jgi:peptidoglycan LD-endopeptidase LytH
MRAQCFLRRSRLLSLLCLVLAAALVFTYPAVSPAAAADPRLEKAEANRRTMQERLNEAYERLHAAQAEVEQAALQLAELQARERAHLETAANASGALAHRIRQSYKLGSPDPSLALFSMQSPEDALQHGRLLGLLAHRSRAELETASAARINTRVMAEQVAEAAEELRARRDAMETARAEAATLLAQAEAAERQVRSTIAAEEAARQRAAELAAARQRNVAQRPSRSGGGAAGAAAPVVGSIACPVGTPRSYSDTYGAPRSGGRSHKGTDIMAPRGTPIYAYESGTITRLNSSRLGGISLYMRGDSGNTYYYTHLQGYVSGISAGQRVSVGQHIAFNGDTGNARGIPHLHFEVMPGGGGNVNPYPYVRRACG